MVSSFLVRLPFGAMLRLLQDGQRSGVLMGERRFVAWAVEGMRVIQGSGWRSGRGFAKAGVENARCGKWLAEAERRTLRASIGGRSGRTGAGL